MRMVRKQIYITHDQDAKLKRLAAERGVAEAELVRGALDALDGVTYRVNTELAGDGRIGETAVKEYAVDEWTDTAGMRDDGNLTWRSRMADKAWQEELAFMKSLTGNGAGSAAKKTWRFNRDEGYEERLDKILRRH